MAKKRNNGFIKANRGAIISTIGFLLLALLILSAGLYSYTPFEKSELKKYETIISNVETNITRKPYVSFTDDTGRRYCFRTNSTGIKKNDLKDSLTQDYSNKKLTIYYTDRIDTQLYSILDNIMGYTRVGAIEYGTETIVSIDDFNQRNNAYLRANVIVSILVFIVFLFKVYFLINDITIYIEKQRNKRIKELKKKQKAEGTKLNQ